MSLQSLEGDNHLCALEKVVGKVQVVGRKGGLEGKRVKFSVKCVKIRNCIISTCRLRSQLCPRLGTQSYTTY